MPLDSPKRLNDDRLYGQPTDDGLPTRKEIMARHVRHSRAEGPAQTKREKGWPSILGVWESGFAAVVTAVMTLFISLGNELAAERSIFQTLKERWAIVAVSAILLFTVGLTIALALSGYVFSTATAYRIDPSLDLNAEDPRGLPRR